MKYQNIFTELQIEWPIIQAPMAGVSTPEMAAAVSNAGGVGSLGLGSAKPESAFEQIQKTKSLTDRPFNVNFFCHTAPNLNHDVHQKWLEYLNAHFQAHDALAPTVLNEIYQNFQSNEKMLEVVLETRPAIVSFHFGAPSEPVVDKIHAYGGKVLVCVTNLREARLAATVHADAIVAQGVEAGGHRGNFVAKEDDALGLFPLLRILARNSELPVIAAGGIMDGVGIDAAMRLGAVGAQLGTAFILCPESSATAAHRECLKGEGAARTAITAAISGRPARGIIGVFQRSIVPDGQRQIPDYPFAYDAAMKLHAAAKEKGIFSYSPNWAGQGAVLCREMPAFELTRALAAEWAEARKSLLV